MKTLPPLQPVSRVLITNPGSDTSSCAPAPNTSCARPPVSSSRRQASRSALACTMHTVGASPLLEARVNPHGAPMESCALHGWTRSPAAVEWTCCCSHARSSPLPPPPYTPLGLKSPVRTLEASAWPVDPLAPCPSGWLPAACSARAGGGEVASMARAGLAGGRLKRSRHQRRHNPIRSMPCDHLTA